MKNNKQIIVNIGSNKIKCPTQGGIIKEPEGFKGQINCPEYTDICGVDSEENLICNEMFDCINKKIETDFDTFSYFPDEDDIGKIIYKSKSEYVKFSFNFFILSLIICIYYN